MEYIKREDDTLRSLLPSWLTQLSRIDFGTNVELLAQCQSAPYDVFSQYLQYDDMTPSPLSNEEESFIYNSPSPINIDFQHLNDIWGGEDSCSSWFSSHSPEAPLTPENWLQPPQTWLQPPQTWLQPPQTWDTFSIEDKKPEQVSPPLFQESGPEKTSPSHNIQRPCKTETCPFIPIQKDEKEKRTRRRRRNLMKPGSQLYQFILQLLDDENKRHQITWVKHKEGIFRIIKKEEVAEMWGNFRKRPMTYDSLSRGLRHYYRNNLLNSVNKKLHYQFTKKALDEWEQIRDKESIEDIC